MHLYKQKVDRVINSRVVAKTRDSIATQIFPTAKVIADVTTTSGVGANALYVDNIKLFNYESTSPNFPITIISNTPTPTVGSLTANVAGGVVTGLNTVSGGSGYTSAPTVSISAPPKIGVGVGTTATATLSVSGGVITGSVITNAGLGYTVAPTVLISPPTTPRERTNNVGFITGFSGIVTGMLTSQVGIITFQTKITSGEDNYNGLVANDYIIINDTTVGTGSSISFNETGISPVSIGSTHLDNIYQIKAITSSGVDGSLVCSISNIGFSSIFSGDNLGKFSFGKLTNVTRGSSPISIGVSGLTVDVGLTTFPTIQRVGGDYTLRNTGALPKTV